MKEVIGTLHHMTIASSSSEDRANIEALISLLTPYEALSTAQLEEMLIAARPKTQKAIPAKKTKTAVVDEALASTYAQSFERAANDSTEVRKIIDALKTDKRVKIGEIAAILSKVRGSEVRVSKKADGLKEIDQWYQRKRDTVRRAKGASEIY